MRYEDGAKFCWWDFYKKSTSPSTCNKMEALR